MGVLAVGAGFVALFGLVTTVQSMATYPLQEHACPASDVALRAIQALEARTRLDHQRLLEDTQSLADEAGSLLRENAERRAEIAALRREIAAFRAGPTKATPSPQR